jgi:lysophospholipase L1-like esterase
MGGIKMNKKLLISILIVVVPLIYFGCDDYTKLTAPEVNLGSADFSRFVSIGNSLTMGEQSSSVFETGQMYSFGKIIANQVETVYEQATISDPGSPGRLEAEKMDPFTIYTNPNQGSPTNLTYPAPYNNLGVKGAFLIDVLNARDQTTCYTAAFGSPNPLFDLVLRGFGTQLELAIAQQPTFTTLWIGHNDILAFATRGGLFPITPVQNFSDNYNAIINALDGVGAEVVLGNICDVKAASFFRTVGPGIGLSLQQNQLPGLVYGKSFGDPGFASLEDLFNFNVLVLLSGSSATGYIGDTSGKYYTDNGISVPPGVDVNFPFGLAPQNPWPNNLILDPDEMLAVDMTVAAYNNVIETEANAKGFAVMDAFSLMQNLAASGITYNGVTYTSEFVQGGFYSLDGVHPTSQGYAVIANEFIKVINQRYGASIPLIDVSTIPGSLVFKNVSMGKYGIPNIPHGALDNIIF